MSHPLVILGAGPAGLGAAYRAATAGYPVVVLERGDRVGGAAGSFEVAGLRVDHGSHRLHRTIDPAILSVLENLLGDDLQQRQRNGRIRLAGRWLAFPLRPADVATSLPPAFAAQTAFDAATAWARRPRADTFAEVVRAGLGPAMLDRFYAPYAEKLWGLPPHRIAGEQARVRVGAATPGAVLRRLAAARDPAARTFLYPRGGFGRISEALADAAAAAGADIRLASTVRSLEEAPDATIDVGTDHGSLAARRVWTTLPIAVLARLWRPAPPDVVAAAARLRSRAMVLVYLVLDVPRYTRFDAHYLPEAWTPVTRISEPKNYRDDPTDPVDRTVLCFEVPCDVGDATWGAPDDELAAVAVDTLGRAGLPDPIVAGVETARLPSAYPVYEVGFEAALDRLDRWVTSLDGVLTFGRQGLFAHDNSHHALTMAWAAVDALRPVGFDADAWGAARERFLEHVVED